jgi:hypothetical protein
VSPGHVATQIHLSDLRLGHPPSFAYGVRAHAHDLGTGAASVTDIDEFRHTVDLQIE